MEENINESIKKLTTYALENKLIDEEEINYSINLLLDVLDLDEYIEPESQYQNVNLEATLKEILDFAGSKSLLDSKSIVERDLFDTKIMNCFTPRPSQVIKTFNELKKEDSKKATDYFYKLSLDSDYIRSYRIKKDLKWNTVTPYGNLDITINLSKPEKDPKAIAAAKNQKQSSYPKCLLCKENIGYRGSLTHPARETIRYIPLNLNGDEYYMQYSPYSYYKEHCIVFNKNHIPMVVNEKTFEHLISFVEQYPTYMLGSNADLPIVGGSILTHDHYQGGSYIFPMFKAKDQFTYDFKGYDEVKASYLCWPLSVIRLRSKNKSQLLSLCNKILNIFRNYNDKEVNVIAYSDNTPHNTITPILHFENEEFVFDLALRNNLTNEEYPLGIYHPHSEYWNIKKENIGLIEVMGTAILPSRLKNEMETITNLVMHKVSLNQDPSIEKHLTWLEGFKDELYSKENEEEIKEVLQEHIGNTFMKVLECAGIFKNDDKGLKAAKRLFDYIDRN